MTAPIVGAPPWAAVEIDPDRVVAELRRRFPKACAWLGDFTGTWWALACDRSGQHHLIEAADPAMLGRLLEELGARERPTPRHARPEPPTGVAGRWLPPPYRPATPSTAAPGRHGRTPRGGWWRRLFGR